MSRSASAWMPLYVGDYLKDTGRLTTEQHGAYLLIIMDYWVNGPPPNDDAILQQITKTDKAAWRRVKPAIIRMFQVTDGSWHHKRVDAEISAAAEHSERRSSKAKRAAEARWGQCSDDAPSNARSNARSNATSNARSTSQALLDECPPPSPITFPNGNGDEPKKIEAQTDPKKVTFDSCLAYLGTKHRAKIAQWVRDHGLPAVDAALIVAKAQNEGQGATEPIPFMEAVLRKGAEREAARAKAEREEEERFNRNNPPRVLSRSEARALMTDAEFARWEQRQAGSAAA